MRNNGISRRGLVGATLGAGLTATAGGAAAGAAGPRAAAAGRAGGGASVPVWLRWLGNNGWEIRVGSGDQAATVLIDPWLTRFRTGTYTAKGADPATPIRVDRELIDGHGLRADQILVTHGHYDHITDVPHLAATTGATVFGTESHVNLMLAMDAPAKQLSMVQGGEYLQFDGYTIEVLRSVHSMVGNHPQVPFPGTRPAAPPPRPRTIADLVEGGSLAYRITAGDLTIVNLGGANYSEADLAGRHADVVMVQPGGNSVHAYVPRLLRILGHPAYVLPTHWDDFDHPLGEPARDWGGLASLKRAVHEASPKSRFVRLEHLETFTP
ncbi:MBL fold metallo-hydrolase [Streptomyces sp. KR80]|uniref:MBL fold metallo-hydrolase n=1 Tax=Streptomyces sp. KR80 TaxID=3457426 RepID=UPI003FD22FD5